MCEYLCRCTIISICAEMHAYGESNGKVGRVPVEVWVEVSEVRDRCGGQ